MEDHSCSLVYFMTRKRLHGDYIHYHVHDSPEIVYYISGSGSTTINNCTFNYERGMISFIDSEVAHCEYCKEDTELICISFTCRNKDLLPSPGIYNDKTGEILLLLNRISKEMENRELGFRSVNNLSVEMLLILLMRCGPKCEVPGEDMHGRNIASSLSYICNNYSENIDFAVLSASLGYSYDRFRHIFRAQYGSTPKQFLDRQRVFQAAFMLRSGNDTVESIARKVGFSGSEQLTYYFRSIKGTTPGDYRKNNPVSSQ